MLNMEFISRTAKGFFIFLRVQNKNKNTFLKSCLTSEKQNNIHIQRQVEFPVYLQMSLFLTYSFKSWTLHGIHDAMP